jgi:hypothetical protein
MYKLHHTTKHGMKSARQLGIPEVNFFKRMWLFVKLEHRTALFKRECAEVRCPIADFYVIHFIFAHWLIDDNLPLSESAYLIN